MQNGKFAGVFSAGTAAGTVREPCGNRFFRSGKRIFRNHKKLTFALGRAFSKNAMITDAFALWGPFWNQASGKRPQTGAQ